VYLERLCSCAVFSKYRIPRQYPRVCCSNETTNGTRPKTLSTPILTGFSAFTEYDGSVEINIGRRTKNDYGTRDLRRFMFCQREVRRPIDVSVFFLQFFRRLTKRYFLQSASYTIDFFSRYVFYNLLHIHFIFSSFALKLSFDFCIKGRNSSKYLLK